MNGKVGALNRSVSRLTIYAIGYSLNFADTQAAGNLTAHVTIVSALMFQ